MNRKVSMLAFAWAVLLVGIVLASGLVQAQTVTVTETLLVGNGNAQYDGTLSGDIAVFTDTRNGSEDLYYVNVKAPAPLPIVMGPGNQRGASVDGGLVVYTDNSLGNENIGLHNLTSGTTSLLDGNGATDITPSISGTDVIFVSNRVTGVTNIYQMNVYAPAPLPLTNTLIAAGTPDSSGTIRAWAEFIGGGFDIVVQIGGGTSFAITSDPGTESKPCVGENLVAYLRDGEVFVYDTITEITTAVIAHPGFAKDAVHLNGTDVIFSDASSGNLDIYVHQISTGLTHALTTDPSDQILTDTDGNRVVFHDDRLGNLNVWALDYSIAAPVPAISSGMLVVATALFGAIGVYAMKRKT